MKSFPPLFRTLLLLNLVAGLCLVAAINWPLPGQASRPLGRDFNDIEARQYDAAPMDVSDVLDRPIFHENRRKPAAVAAEPYKAPPVQQLKQPYVLVGIVGGSGGSQTAYLLNKDTQDTVSAKEGDQVGIWLVKKINQSSVTLVSDKIVRILEMTSGN